jgi:hypothetical protein
MVVSALIVFAIIPTMVLLRRDAWSRRIGIALGAGFVGGAVYGITNPYVPINFFTNYDVIRSNISNSTAMYGVGRFKQFITDGLRLMMEGLSPPLMIAGAAGVVVLIVKRHAAARNAGVLLAVPAIVVAVQFFALAAGKPGEYARFALVPNMALAIAAVAGLARLPIGPRARAAAAGMLVLIVMPFGVRYVASFVRDVGPINTRLRAAEDLRSLPGPVYLTAEPAPYSCPPTDLFERTLFLIPPDQPPPRGRGILVRAVDEPFDLIADGPQGLPLRDEPPGFVERTPISWASKTFAVRYLAQPNAPR